MLLFNEIGRRVLGRCYYSSIVTKKVIQTDNTYYEVELEVRLPRGKNKNTSFLVRVEDETILVKESPQEERRVPLFVVTRKENAEKKATENWTLSVYCRRHSSHKIQCKQGVLYLPIFLNKDDLDDVAYLTIYPSLIEDEEKLVIESDSLVIKQG